MTGTYSAEGCEINDRVSLLVRALQGAGIEIEEDETHPAVAVAPGCGVVVAEGGASRSVAVQRKHREMRPSLRARFLAGELLDDEECEILFGSDVKREVYLKYQAAERKAAGLPRLPGSPRPPIGTEAITAREHDEQEAMARRAREARARDEREAREERERTDRAGREEAQRVARVREQEELALRAKNEREAQELALREERERREREGRAATAPVSPGPLEPPPPPAPTVGRSDAGPRARGR